MQRDDTEHLSDTAVKKKKRFLLVKLEDRIVPAHLPSVHVPDAPGIGVAQARQPHLEFIVRDESVAGSGSGGSLVGETALCSGSIITKS